jgi:hypothetical protein
MVCSDETTKSGPLYLRRKPGENEKRPIEPCTDFWMCPDLAIDGGIDAGTAKAPAGPNDPPVENRIKVTVRNAAASTIQNVAVQVWVCDYGVGIGPKGGIPSAGGANGLGPRLLGDIASGGSATAVLRWFVTYADAQRNPDGHHCIIANAFGDAPDTGVQIRTNPLPTQDVIFICCDSHHGWRNINVKVASSMLIAQGEERFEFPFLLGNPTEGDLEGTLTVTEAGSGGFGITERDHLLSGGLVEWTDPGQDPECTRLVLGGDATLPPEEQVIVRGTGRRMVELGLDGEFGTGAGITFALPPDGTMPMRVTGVFDPDTQPGEVFVFDVIQRNGNGDVLAGARMLAAVVR